MEASIDNTKRDLHNWIMYNKNDYLSLEIKFTANKPISILIAKLMMQRNKVIEIYLETYSEHSLEFIIELNRDIKQLLGL